VHLRVEPDQLAAIEAWAASQDDAPSRPEAIRRLVDKALSGANRQPKARGAFSAVWS
jgi:hypothetical protein